MKKLLFGLALGLFVLFSPSVQAAPHSVGSNIITPQGTVYTITEENSQVVRRPYTSGGAFLSYNFNTWESIVGASSEDLGLPEGSFIPPQDGKVICSDRGADKGTCYLVTNGQKAGFTSADVFTKLGYSFKNVAYGDISFLPSATHLDSPTQAHSPGTLVKKGQAVYLVCDKFIVPLPSEAVLNSWGYSFNDVVLANSTDGSFPESGVLTERSAADLTPSSRCYKPIVPSPAIKVSPTSGQAGTQVSIFGSGFSSSGNSVLFFQSIPGGSPGSAMGVLLSLKSYDGTSLSFTVPTKVGLCSTDTQVACDAAPAQTPTGTYLISVTTDGSFKGSSAFTIGPIPSNSITVHSPAGGEVWPLGSTQTVKWSAPTSVSKVNISISGYYPCLSSNSVCLMPVAQPIIIASGVPNTGYYNWIIPNCTSANPCSSNFQIPAGEYTLTISDINNYILSGTSRPFSLTSSDSTPGKPPVISGVSGPTSLNINQAGNWTIKAYDPDGSYLSYSVDWGDVAGGTVPLTPISLSQTGTFTHTYSQAGDYKVVFTVNDASGLSAQSSLSVSVGKIPGPTSTITGQVFYDENGDGVRDGLVKESSNSCSGLLLTSSVPLFSLVQISKPGVGYGAAISKCDTSSGNPSPGPYFSQEVDRNSDWEVKLTNLPAGWTVTSVNPVSVPLSKLGLDSYNVIFDIKKSTESFGSLFITNPASSNQFLPIGSLYNISWYDGNFCGYTNSNAGCHTQGSYNVYVTSDSGKKSFLSGSALASVGYFVGSTESYAASVNYSWKAGWVKSSSGQESLLGTNANFYFVVADRYDSKSYAISPPFQLIPASSTGGN